MFLKNKNIIFKIRRSKVTDYAALNGLLCNCSISWSYSLVFVLFKGNFMLAHSNGVARMLKKGDYWIKQ